MKKKICFAGFGEGELAALQHSMGELGSAWDCVCPPDTASALQVLASAPFDAVVANLTAAGITNPELLQQAAVRHPRTLRFVLGDVSDRELIVNCMGVPHQFISRPWRPSDLISIIERSLALDAWLNNDKLRQFVPRLGKLPGLPSSYFEVLKKAESSDTSVEAIGEVIGRDPTLTARLLQMANSSACGLSEKITSPTEAVAQLGMDTVKSLVLCLQLFAKSAPVEGASFSLDQLWQTSFSVAKLSARIAQRSHWNDRMIGDAYTAGLLHNIGQIVLATNLSSEYSVVVKSARKRKCPLHQVELEELGVTSNQIGAYLLGIWGMPLSLTESTALHHTPGVVKSPELSVLTMVHVASVLAAEAAGGDGEIPLPKLDPLYLSALQLPRKPDAWRKHLAAGEHVDSKFSHLDAEQHPATSTDDEQPANRSGKLVLAAVAAVILLVAFFAFRRGGIASPASTGETQPQLAAAEPAQPMSPKPPAPDEPSQATPEPNFDSLKIQGILYNAGHPVVLINGKTYEAGEQINGIHIDSIESPNIILSSKGAKKTFRLK